MTSFRSLRLLQHFALVCLEATLVHLVVWLVTSASGTPILRWWVLVLVAACAAAVTAVLEPLNADATRIKRMSGVIAIVVIWLATTMQAGNPGLGGPWQTLRSLVSLNDPQFFRTYLALGTSMYAWGRGGAVVDMGHGEVVRLLRRAVVALAVIVGALAVAGYDPGFAAGENGAGVGLVVELLGFILLGFVSLSLTRIVETAGQGTPGSSWRWFRSGVLSTTALILMGVLLLAVLADPAGTVLRELIRWAVFAMITLLSPLIALVLTLVEYIRQLIPESAAIIQPVGTATATSADQPPVVPGIQVPDAVLIVPVIIALVLPLIMLVLLIIFARRRRSRTETESDEQRESIFSWGALRSDLADLLRGLRGARGDQGLRGRLRALGSVDPAERIRRRYIQLLLKGEDAGRKRRPAETPYELAPGLGSVVDPRAAVMLLTETYQQARYAPDTVDELAARRADEAWDTLNNDTPR